MCAPTAPDKRVLLVANDVNGRFDPGFVSFRTAVESVQWYQRPPLDHGPQARNDRRRATKMAQQQQKQQQQHDSIQAALAAAGLIGAMPSFPDSVQTPEMTMGALDGVDHSKDAGPTAHIEEDRPPQTLPLAHAELIAKTSGVKEIKIEFIHSIEDGKEKPIHSTLISLADATMTVEEIKRIATRYYEERSVQSMGFTDEKHSIPYRVAIRDKGGYGLPMHLRACELSTGASKILCLEYIAYFQPTSRDNSTEKRLRRLQEMENQAVVEKVIPSAGVPPPALAVAEKVYKEYMCYRLEHKLSMQEALGKLGARLSDNLITNNPSDVRKFVKTSLVDACSTLDARMQMAREMSVVESCSSELDGLKQCRSIQDILDMYRSNRAVYDPHDVMPKLLRAFMPGTIITLKEGPHWEEKYGANMRAVNTAICMCVLAENNAVPSFESLETLLD